MAPTQIGSEPKLQTLFLKTSFLKNKTFVDLFTLWVDASKVMFACKGKSYDLKHRSTLVCHLLRLLSLWWTGVKIPAGERVIYNDSNLNVNLQRALTYGSW